MNFQASTLMMRATACHLGHADQSFLCFVLRLHHQYPLCGYIPVCCDISALGKPSHPGRSFDSFVRESPQFAQRYACWSSAGNEGMHPINHPPWFPSKEFPSGSFPSLSHQQVNGCWSFGAMGTSALLVEPKGFALPQALLWFH